MFKLSFGYHSIPTLCVPFLLVAQVSVAQDALFPKNDSSRDHQILLAEDASNSPTTLPTPELLETPIIDPNLPVGNMPKPTDTDLDPDFNNNGEELKPDQDPELNPQNSLAGENPPENLLVGATFALSNPHVINLGLESVFYEKFGASLNYGNITETMKNVAINVKHVDFRMRWFPWKSSFFAGLALGRHWIKGDLHRVATIPSSGQQVAIHGNISASASYFAPQIGWFATWESGFTLGADVGCLFPNSQKSNFTSSINNPPAGTEAEINATKEYSNMKSELESISKSFLGKPKFMITIMRFGWMF
jgi:hypothetical protein